MKINEINIKFKQKNNRIYPIKTGKDIKLKSE